MSCSRWPATIIDLMKKSGDVSGMPWMCTTCKHNLPTMRKMEQTLGEIQKTSSERMNVIEGKLDDMVDTMERKIKEKVDEEIPKMINVVEKTVSDTVSKRLNIMENRMDELVDEKMAVINKKIDDHVSTKEIAGEGVPSPVLNQKIKEAVEAEVKAKVPSDQNIQTKQPVSPGTQMKQTIATVTAELKDREERRKNIVLHGVKEPDTNLKEERVRYDKEEVMKVCNEVLRVPVTMEDLKDARRLGEKSETMTRPLKICMASENLKNSIFKKLVRLRGSEYDNLAFTHDMTKMEREQRRKLVGEAREQEKEEGGKWRYRVRGPPWEMKIVKLEQVRKEKEPETPMETSSQARGEDAQEA